MSTTFQTTNRTSYGKFSIVVTENSTNISSNTSDVTVDLKYTSADQYYCGVSLFTITDATGVVLGTFSRSYGVVSHISQGTQTLKTFSNLTANHLNDGTGSLTIYIKYRIGNTTNYEETFTFTSTRIPRASNISSSTTSMTITKTSTAGVTVTVTPQTTGFYHIVTYSTTGSGGSGTLVNKVAINSATTYTLTKANILTAIPNRQTDTLVFTCSTYSDSACTVQVGSATSVSLTVILDQTLKPTVTISSVGVSTTSGEYSISGYLIADGKTKSTVAYSTTLQTGATLASIVFSAPVGTFPTVTAASGTAKSNAIPTGLTSSVQYKVYCTVTDSRGFVTAFEYVQANLYCYAYAKPLINIIAYRVATNTGDDATKEDPAGAFLYYRLEGSITQIGSANAVKAPTATTNTYIQVGSGTKSKINTNVWTPLALDATATINARLEDNVSYSTASFVVGAASFPIDLVDDSAGNVGGGFGTVATAGQYEFAYPAMGPGTIEFIRGTQAATTGTWTGVSKQKALREGMIISYYLPFAGNGNATLNLTLADGTTTGAKNCYFNSTTRLSTHFGQYSQFSLVYHENFNINGTNYTGWWVLDKGYDTTNTLALRKYRGYVAATAIYRYQLCLTKDAYKLLPINTVSNSVAKTKTLTTESFDPFGAIFYYSSTTTVSANANAANDNFYTQYLMDIRYSFNTGGNDVASTLTSYRPVYLVCVPQADGTAKLHTSPLSQTLPSTVDGLIYIYLGQMYPDTYPYRLHLEVNHPIYYYDGTKVAIWTGKPATTTASSVITRSSGATVTYAHAYKTSNIVTIYCELTYSTSVASGSDIFSGTLSSTYLPPYDVETSAYYQNHFIGIRIQPDGTITVRNASASAVTISSGIYWSATYVVA